MRNYHCDACKIDTAVAGTVLGGGHCPQCGAAVAEIAGDEAGGKTYAAIRIDSEAVMASFGATVVNGGMMAATVEELTETAMDAVIMVGGVYLFFCLKANFHPVQLMELLQNTITVELKPDKVPS